MIALSTAIFMVIASTGIDVAPDKTFKMKGLSNDVFIGESRGTLSETSSPKMKTSFKFGSSEEKVFLSATRPGAVKSVPSADDSKVTFAGANTLDEFTIAGDTLQWNVTYVTDPRLLGIGDYVETWDLNFPAGVTFYYQPPLTAKEVKEGIVRPDNIVGSYAVFGNKAGNFTDVHYESGKLGHIYRPQIVDAKGNQAWCDLNISNKRMEVTIPEPFLDSAMFPVTLDPDFGNTTIGGTQDTMGGQVRFIFSTPTVAGVGTSMSMYTGETASNNAHTVQMKLYQIDPVRTNWTGITNGLTESRQNIQTGQTWYVFNFTASPTITPVPAGYALAASANSATGNLKIYYDSVPNSASSGIDPNTSVFAEPLNEDTAGVPNRYFSMYVTYSLPSTDTRAIFRSGVLRGGVIR